MVIYVCISTRHAPIELIYKYMITYGQFMVIFVWMFCELAYNLYIGTFGKREQQGWGDFFLQINLFQFQFPGGQLQFQFQFLCNHFLIIFPSLRYQLQFHLFQLI